MISLISKIHCQDFKTYDYFDSVYVNGFHNSKSQLQDLYKIFGSPISKYVPDYEMCGDGFDTVFYYNGITFYYLNWNKRNIKTSLSDYIWFNNIYLRKGLIVNVGKIELTDKTKIDKIAKIYPNSFKNRIVKDNEVVMKISACIDCQDESYFELYFIDKKLIRITYYSADC